MTRRRLPAIIVLGLVVAGRLPARAGVDEAEAAFKAGRYLEAASELQAVVDRSPNYSWGFLLLGHCMLKMHRPGVAELHFRRAIELDPARAESYLGLAMALTEQGDWADTIQAATDGLGRSQAQQRMRYTLLALRGNAWVALQRWDKAVADLEAGRRIHQEPWAVALLGKAYFAMGGYRQAIAPLTWALKAAPDDPIVLRVLAESYLRVAGEQTNTQRKRADYTQALGFAQHLAAVVPDDLEVVHLVGRAALGAGRLEQAESVFLHVVSLDPRQCYAMVNLGRTYFAAERYKEAEAALTRAASCAPRLAVVFETLGDLYLKRGMAPEAAAAFERAAELTPTEGGAGSRTIRVSVPR